MYLINILQYTLNAGIVGFFVYKRDDDKEHDNEYEAFSKSAVVMGIATFFFLSTLIGLVCLYKELRKHMWINYVLLLINTLSMSLITTYFSARIQNLAILQASIMLLVIMVATYWVGPCILDAVPSAKHLRKVTGQTILFGAVIVSGLIFYILK